MKKISKFSIEIDQTYLSEIEDLYNGHTEIYVRLEDGFRLSILVGTPQNLEFLMEKDKIPFFEPGRPWLIVQKLTTEIIHEAVEAYMNDRPDGYWLKLSYFGDEIDISVFDQLQTKEIETDNKYSIILGLDELKNKIDKYQDSLNKEHADIIADINELYKFVNVK